MPKFKPSPFAGFAANQCFSTSLRDGPTFPRLAEQSHRGCSGRPGQCCPACGSPPLPASASPVQGSLPVTLPIQRAGLKPGRGWAPHPLHPWKEWAAAAPVPGHWVRLALAVVTMALGDKEGSHPQGVASWTIPRPLTQERHSIWQCRHSWLWRSPAAKSVPRLRYIDTAAFWQDVLSSSIHTERKAATPTLLWGEEGGSERLCGIQSESITGDKCLFFQALSRICARGCSTCCVYMVPGRM